MEAGVEKGLIGVFEDVVSYGPPVTSECVQLGLTIAVLTTFLHNGQAIPLQVENKSLGAEKAILWGG